MDSSITVTVSYFALFLSTAWVHLHRARVAVEFTSTLAKSLITLALVQLGSSSSSSNGSAGGAAPGQQQLLAKALGALFGVRGGGSSGLPPALVFSVAQLSLSLVVLLGYGAVGLRLLRRGRRQQVRGQRLRGCRVRGTAAGPQPGTGPVHGCIGRRGGSALSESECAVETCQ